MRGEIGDGRIGGICGFRVAGLEGSGEKGVEEGDKEQTSHHTESIIHIMNKDTHPCYIILCPGDIQGNACLP
jgi:hypothetical protein